MLRIGACAAGLAMVWAAAAGAQEIDGFQTPTGNIACMYWSDADGSSMRCDIGAISNRPPRAPADCDLDWGNAFEIGQASRRGVRICHGDTVRDPGLPVLAYGRSFRRGAFICSSERSGVTCRNGRGAGFTLARARQMLF